MKQNRQKKSPPCWNCLFFLLLLVVAWKNMNLKCVYWIIFLWNSIKYFITFYGNYDFFFFFFIAFGECTDIHSFLVKLYSIILQKRQNPLLLLYVYWSSHYRIKLKVNLLINTIKQYPLSRKLIPWLMLISFKDHESNYWLKIGFWFFFIFLSVPLYK